MATSIVAFEVSCPAGCSFLSGPLGSVNVGTDPVVAIRWRVPPGPNGLLQWWLGQDGVPIFPNALGTGVIANDEWDTWPIDSPTSNPLWSLYAINAGTLAHVVELQFYCQAAAVSGGTTGDITAGFPTTSADFLTAFGGGSGGGGVLV
jgi:hypothetical protein